MHDLIETVRILCMAVIISLISAVVFFALVVKWN